PQAVARARPRARQRPRRRDRDRAPARGLRRAHHRARRARARAAWRRHRGRRDLHRRRAGARGRAGAMSDDFVQSLARGLAVIRAFAADHAELTLSEVARRAELPRAAARRFLRTLDVLGYVRSDGKVFRLTPRVLELGFSYLSALSLPEIAQPHLERLSHELDESVSAAVLDGDDI